MKNPLARHGSVIIVLFLGFALGYITYRHTHTPSLRSSTGQVRVNLPQYRFINPPLFSDSNKSDEPLFEAFAAKVQAYIDRAEREGRASSASVYLRDLNSGQWTGVNEDDLYTPSSMLKVVAMMAALKLAENDPSILSKKLQDLIGRMIKYSDNDAFDAVVSDKRINAEFVQTYSLFRLPPDALTGNTTDFMSPKSFSTVFRTLYNSSFFGWNLSEQVLDLLSQTTFTEGLVAGVPENTLAAHKFGENTDELHDCGIVYYPGHPYLICVMTRGTEIPKLEGVIQDLSRSAWDLASELNPQRK